MNKLLVALIAGALASAVAAQNPITNPSEKTKAKQQEVQSVTSQQAPSSVDTQKVNQQRQENVKASKDTTKMTTQEKKAFAKEVNKSAVNPENPSGSVAGTAAQQKENTATSKATPKQNTELKTKEGKAQLEKELQKKSTGQ